MQSSPGGQGKGEDLAEKALGMRDREMLEDIKRWLTCLPTGVAEMQVDTSREGYDVFTAIRPLLSLGGSEVRIGIRHDRFDVWAGRHLSALNVARLIRSPVEYCRAIALGGLTEVMFSVSGEVVGWRTELRLDEELLHRQSSEHPQLSRPWSGLLGWRQRRERKQVISYLPYYELVPDLNKPFGSVTAIPPIFANSQGDVELFSSIREAELNIEPWTVLNK